MTDAGAYYLFDPEGGQPRGPFSLDNLRELAQVQAINPETRIAVDPHVGSLPLKEITELHAALFPAVQGLRLRGHIEQEDDGEESYEKVDVLDILQQNRAQEGPDEREYTSAPSSNRRKRDFFLLMLIAWTLALANLFFVTGPNPVSLVFTISLLTVLTIGSLWLFFVVLDY